MTIVDIQFSPASTDWATLRDAALWADESNYGALWVFDHLAGVALGGDTMLEAFALLGALAELTERIELGTLVANVWNRQPGTLVSAAAAIGIMSGRLFHLGLGAGTAPGSRWAVEQVAAGHQLEPDVERRHARVADVLELCQRQWSDDRDAAESSFPLPRPRPTTIVGVNSIALSEMAGRSADGINVPWRHDRRDAFLDAANAIAGERPFLRTTYTTFERDLLDPEHPDRVAMAERNIDRLVLSQFGTPDLIDV
jgi:alkanesulfonate monooxygenase SsuD/methylene tetrahydromethanopterin reductase-like flavin-dependent oxidoreductase (luciferase family)